ncbi:hypothetical protein [Cryocola sp. 340MFSha3.1]|uniref:hypothetical protein n=1 Tax=Cryocola sp. 340MFSha3.1 TaxID=1169145 RepID=UPI0012DEDF95|nr:hypothetical protein [Cryocola sp. 340MFSha3.1]
MATALSGAFLIGVGLTGFASPDAARANAVDAVAAIEKVAPAAVSEVARDSGDSGTSARMEVGDGTTVSVPLDARAGLHLDAPAAAPDITIGLPFADRATAATGSQKAGVVVYDNNNGSSTVPVVHRDGTIQISTVIENAGAPTRYDYPIDVPADAALVEAPDGTVAVVAPDGAPLAVFGAAWAKDADGNPVPTHYRVTGNTLTQVVEHGERTVYPVVADPSTGVYSYNCVLTNGSSYFMAPGSALTNCKGSYLKKYINGAMVKSVALAYNGGGSAVKVTGAGWCIASLAGVAALAWNPLTATGAWLLGTASTLLGAYGSCYQL